MSQEPSEAEKLVGQVLANTYRIEKLLVEGGMGAVFKGRHLRTGGLCAIKILHTRAAANQEIYERFQDEARIISALRHPNIVQVIDLDKDASGHSFIVMELLEGEDLQDRLERCGRIPLPEALEIVKQVASGLHAAHLRGVIHRDLKPRNIFLHAHELNGQLIQTAKIIDFGVSKIPRPSEKMTRDLLVLGTPRYMAPEGALGQNSQIDGRSDEWSVAVILYRMLSGKLPFDQENVIDLFKQVVNDDPTPLEVLAPDVPTHVAAAVRRALSKKKEDRFPNLIEFQAALEPPKPVATPKAAESSMLVSVLGKRSRSRLSLRRMVVFGVIGAALSGAAISFVLQRTPGSGRRFQSTDLLLQADQALLEERWNEASEIADRALKQPKITEAMRSAAEITKKRAQNGLNAHESYQRLLTALEKKDYDTALGINRELPPSLSLRVTAQQHYDLLLPLVIGNHIQKAEAARNLGQCAEVHQHVEQILNIVPEHEGALQARWRPCATFAAFQPPGPKKLAGYPPIRDEGSGGPELPGDYPGGKTSLVDIDRFVREAALASQNKQHWRAITLAHAAVGTVRSPTAWRILGISACALHNLRLLRYAAEHEPASREYLRTGCEKLGFPSGL